MLSHLPKIPFVLTWDLAPDFRSVELLQEHSLFAVKELLGFSMHSVDVLEGFYSFHLTYLNY
jgi:hypothetical protein